jgi:hypothetical protein
MADRTKDDLILIWEMDGGPHPDACERPIHTCPCGEVYAEAPIPTKPDTGCCSEACEARFTPRCGHMPWEPTECHACFTAWTAAKAPRREVRHG